VWFLVYIRDMAKQKITESEHFLQCEVVEFCRLNKEFPDLKKIYAVPNAARRSLRQGAKMKAEGMRSGVPDLVLPIGKGGFFGLYIEMKTKGGSLSDNQKIVLGELKYDNYKIAVCYSSEEAIDLLSKYIQMEGTVEYYEKYFKEKYSK